MRQVLWIPGKLPSYTDLMDAALKHRAMYSKLKKGSEEKIRLLARQARLRPIKESHQFAYLFVEPDRRRDPGNILSGAVKLIEDALRAEKILPNDGWAWVHGITPHFVTVEHNREQDGALLVMTTDEVVLEESELESALYEVTHG